MERRGQTMSRRNTFQKMLDLERRNTMQRRLDLEHEKELKRMSAQMSANVPLAQARSNDHGQQRPEMPSKPTRAMTAPNLSLSIPPTDASSTKQPATAPSTERIGAFLIPEVVESKDMENESDVSSICHSPGWDDAETKKARKLKQEAKEKRKKEKERAAREAKKADNPKKRLVKAPPTNKLSKMMILADRSISAPAVPMRSEAEVLKEIEEKTKVKDGNGSADAGFNTFLQATRAIPGPWNMPPPTSFEKMQQLRASDGFIGGLKLRMADEVRLQGIRERASTNGVVERPSTGDHLVERRRSRESISQKIRYGDRILNTTIEVDGDSPLSNRHSYPSQPAPARPVTAPNLLAENIPIMERSIKRKNKSRKSSPDDQYSEPKVLSEVDSKPRDRSRRGASSGSGSSRPKSGNDESSPKPIKHSRTSGTSSERPPISYREPSALPAESSRGRQRSGSYVQNERQLTKDTSINGFEDENRVSSARASTKSRSRGRSWSIASLTGRTRKSTSQSRPMTGGSEKTTVLNAGEDYHTFLTNNYTSSQDPPKRESTILPKENSSVPSRRLSILSPTAASFKNAAKGVFSKYQQYSHTPGAYTRHFFSSPDPLAQPKQNLRTRASNLSSHSSGSKVDRILGASVTSLMKGISEVRPTSSRTSSNVPVDQSSSSAYVESTRTVLPPLTLEEPQIDQISPSRSATDDSSEDFPDQSTNASTPMTSRPHSHKGQNGDLHNKGSSTSTKLNAVENGCPEPSMSGGLPFDDTASTHEGWSRTAVPLELDDDEECSKAPISSKKSIPNFSHRQSSKERDPVPIPRRSSKRKSKENASQRQSSSSPDLQDLSFLPQLKHQPLARPEKRQEKQEATKKLIPVNREKGTQALFKPPPTPPSPSSPPLSPMSGQYLRNARLAIPPPTTSKKHKFPPLSTGPTPMQNIEPIAKMFVICCSCRYFHDMPSKIYECMAKPDNVVEDKELGVRGVISTNVRCPWCGHGMSTGCCEGYAAVVHLSERLH